MLAESLVAVDAGVLPRDASFRGDCMVRPLGASSERRPIVSSDGLLGLGDRYPAWLSLATSRLALGTSVEGRAKVLAASSDITLAEELEGRVGGDGGA